MKPPDSSSQASYRLRRVFYASHQKLIPRSFCCSSLPNRTRCAGLRFGLGNENIRNEAACTRYGVQAAFYIFLSRAMSDHIVVSRFLFPHQIGKGNVVQIVADDLVQSFPKRQSPACLHPRAGIRAFFQTGDRGQGVLC